MQKLKLNIEDLSVESFEVIPGEPNGRGTVAGHVGEDEIIDPIDGADYAASCPCSGRWVCTFSLIWALCGTV